MRDGLSRTAERLLDMLARAPGGFRREGSAALATCPRCGRRKLHFRLVDPPKADYPCRFSCFSGACSGGRWDGKPEFALAEMLGISVGAAKAELYATGLVVRSKVVGLDLPGSIEQPEEPAIVPHEWPTAFIPILEKGAERGLAYLEGRGIPAEVAHKYKIRYNPIGRSVVFPVEDQGFLVGWQERLVIPHEWVSVDGVANSSAKAKTSKGFNRSHWMFGDHLLRSDHAFVLEGPVDAIKADWCGGNVASLGKELTPALIARLAAYPWKKLYCGLDEGTYTETVRLVREFDQIIRHPGRTCYLVDWPKGKDAGKLSFAEVRERFDAARPTTADLVVFDMSQNIMC